ncbi:MAG TPA: hypothetical protein VIT42_04525, partial [Microlunatus sp.]
WAHDLICGCGVVVELDRWLQDARRIPAAAVVARSAPLHARDDATTHRVVATATGTSAAMVLAGSPRRQPDPREPRRPRPDRAHRRRRSPTHTTPPATYAASKTSPG